MKNITEIFKMAWDEFAEEYKSEEIFSIELEGGSPSKKIWGEADIQWKLAVILQKLLPPNKTIHLEVPNILPNRRIDMVISDICSRSEINILKFDLTIEIAVINNNNPNQKNLTNYYKGEPFYNIPKVRENAGTIRETIVKGKSKGGFVCVINKVDFAKSKDYEEIENEFKIEILYVHDNIVVKQ